MMVNFVSITNCIKIISVVLKKNNTKYAKNSGL